MRDRNLEIEYLGFLTLFVAEVLFASLCSQQRLKRKVL